MTFQLDLTLQEVRQDCLNGTLHHMGGGVISQREFKKLSRALRRWKNLLFDPDFLKKRGLKKLEKEQITIIDERSPTFEIHAAASRLHQAVFPLLKANGELTGEQITDIEQSFVESARGLHGRKFKQVRQDLALFSKNVPLMIDLSEKFLSSSPDLKGRKQVRKLPDQKPAAPVAGTHKRKISKELPAAPVAKVHKRKMSEEMPAAPVMDKTIDPVEENDEERLLGEDGYFPGCFPPDMPSNRADIRDAMTRIANLIGFQLYRFHDFFSQRSS